LRGGVTRLRSVLLNAGLECSTGPESVNLNEAPIRGFY